MKLAKMSTISNSEVEEVIPLSFSANTAGSTIKLTKIGSPTTITLYYKLNDSNWTAYTIDQIITLTNIGDVVSFKGTTSTFSSSTSNYYQFVMTGSLNGFGNTNSLINYKTLTNYCFINLFNGCTFLITPPELPATTLTPYCYRQMFQGCTSLIQAPELPATNFGGYWSSCEYYLMFYNCTSLKYAPKLPATTLTNHCYNSMFAGCTSLIQAPELPATNLMGCCYYNMFQNCTSLKYAPELPATTLAAQCYNGMFYGCTSLKYAPKLPATTLASYCYLAMFRNCTSLTSAPELPATTLAASCYHSMFYGCTSLSSAPELPATTLATQCYQNMFSNCTSLNSAPKLPATTLTQCCYYYMFYNCKSLNSTPELPATTLAQSCYDNMFYGCSSLSAIPILPATTLAPYCYRSMFQGAGKNIKQVPRNMLPATTLAPYCYNNMFQGCFTSNSVTSAVIPDLPATKMQPYCYAYMYHTTTYLTSIPTNLLSHVTQLAEGCFKQMFAYCLRFNKAPILPSATLVKECYREMFYRCEVTNNIEVQFTDWKDDLSATYQWVYGTWSTGTFTKPNDLDEIRNISHIPAAWSIKSNENTPLKFTALEDNASIQLTKFGEPDQINLSYNINRTNWINYNINDIITLSANQKIYFQNSTNTLSKDLNNYYQFNLSGLFTASQNIYSLINNSSLTDYCFYNLFNNCSGLVSAPNLISTQLANNCYQSMFENCTNLSAVPNLPATNLTSSCYNSMFKGCTTLSSVQLLSATNLANNCYQSMFENCTNLNNILVLFSDWKESLSATTNWVNNVANSGVFYCNKNLPSAIQDSSHIPVNWAVSSEFKKLNYLESTGTQYIDTNIVIGSCDNFSCDAKISFPCFGGGDDGILGTVNDNFWLGIANNKTNASYKKGVGGVTPTISYQINLNQIYNIHLQNGFYKLDDIEHIFNKVSGYSNNNSITLFSGKYGSSIYGKSAVRIHEVKFYRGIELVGYFIPVFDITNNKPAMYDLVTKQFFYNQGTGEFNYN